jgi:cell division protein FtsB
VSTFRDFEREQADLRSRLFSTLFIISALENQLAKLKAEREQLEQRLADLPMEADTRYWTRFFRFLRTGK